MAAMVQGYRLSRKVRLEPVGKPKSRTVGRKPYDCSSVHDDSSDRVILPALGAAVASGLRILPAADCFLVGIIASHG